nr:MAG TPA: hypothetical protein [Caudoviricetes sp.]
MNMNQKDEYMITILNFTDRQFHYRIVKTKT